VTNAGGKYIQDAHDNCVFEKPWFLKNWDKHMQEKKVDFKEAKVLIE